MLLQIQQGEMQFPLPHRKGFKKIFSNLNMQIQKDEIVAILGPSGCGKSTLLKLVAGLEKISAGQIQIRSQLGVGFVFQEANLLPWRTVKENIFLPADLQKKDSPEIQNRLQEILRLVRLEGYGHYFPHQLSGGMKMRVNFARALLLNPELILMDEPFSALDENTRQDLQMEFRNLIKQNKSSAIFVTHAMSEAIFVADRVYIMNFRGDIIFESQISLPELRNSEIKRSVEYLNQVQHITEIFRQTALAGPAS